MLSYASLLVLLPAILAVGYALYRAALPKPIPGIAHNKHAAHRILGDVPEALKYSTRTSEMTAFLTDQIVKMNEPIIQLFLRPFGKPWVVVSDFQEAQDVLLRRTREFDRSEFFGELFSNILPTHQVHLPTGAEWKAHRRLTADTMSTHFLNDVISPQISKSIGELVQLWKEKARLADGHPFSAHQDIRNASLDTIFAATFGSSTNTTHVQNELLKGTTSVNLPDDKDLQADIPAAPTTEAYESIVTITESSEIPLKSPFPRIHHKLALQLNSKLRKAVVQKDKIVEKELRDSWERFSSGSEGDQEVACALDLLMQREAQMAKKEERKADWNTQMMRDELFGFLVAGHDTTGTVMEWILKSLTREQDVQKKLRSLLHEAFSDAFEAGRTPSAKEICKAHLPYLDAVLEEISRHSSAAGIISRVATVDTQLLGHHIPKGTDVFFSMYGPSYLTPAFSIDEKLRSESSRSSKDRYGAWDPSNMHEFIPERWLERDENGREAFNSRSGPFMAFGAGIRACFGRKLAEMQLHIFTVMMVWHFDLQPTPSALSSFDKHEKLTTAPQQCYVRLAERK